jgi:hypothetical protein
MGIEYSLRFGHPGPAAVISVLERLPSFRRSTSDSPDFELRAEGTSEGMPDASLRIEPDGVYFCNYGGSGKQFLGEVVARLVSEFGAVTVTEWE